MKQLHGVQRAITEQAYLTAAVPLVDLAIEEAKQAMQTYLDERGLTGQMKTTIIVRVEAET